MTKISTKELIICIIAILALVLALTTDAFASSVQDDINILLGDANNTADGFNEIPKQNSAGNNTANNTANRTGNNTANNTVNKAANNNAKANNTIIPDAGLDQSFAFIIAIFGISAVYAYKKIRDYKNV